MKLKRKFVLGIFSLFCFVNIYAKDFSLIGKDVRFYLDSDAAPVVKTSAEIFLGDYKSVTGTKLGICSEFMSQPNKKIVVATLGKSQWLNDLKTKYTVDLSYLDGAWEAFSIQVINDGQTLLVAGSDDRGTAYGVLELSRLIGVSPWVWWADSKPEKKTTMLLPSGYRNEQKPSVQFRGIFLNDEDWGLMPWSMGNFEPSTREGNIGPKTYGKIFELLLRLRANTLWPAMHECTVPFFFVEGNKEMAEKYGISLGSSHCEPMNRNSAGEWDKSARGDYDYVKNSDSVKKYWEERVREVAKSNTILTIGMRGVHDGKMQGANTIDEQRAVLERVIVDQREMIRQYINPDETKVPQAFVPYKEVLDIYDSGLKVPEDITLIWCDDNYGYIKRLSNEEEQKRPGGAGIYYHISYWGRPHDYLWLATTQPALMFTEMKRAWDYNARKMWIVNVGDIKPGEYLTELFLDMAWNIDQFNYEYLNTHMQNFFDREFGIKDIANIMNEYYRLAHIRKPEHMGWSRVEESGYTRGRSPVKDTDYSTLGLGEELFHRLYSYKNDVETPARKIAEKIAKNKRSAYFQLVEYPTRAASLMNQKHLFAQLARQLAKHNLRAAAEYKKMSNSAYSEIEKLTQKYNILENGKWNKMMDMRPRSLAVFNPAPMEGIPDIINQTETVVWLDNDSVPLNAGEQPQGFIFNESGLFVCINIFTPKEGKHPIKIISRPKWLITLITPFVDGHSKLIMAVNDGEISGKEQDSKILKFSVGKQVYSVPVKFDNRQIEYVRFRMLDKYASSYAPEWTPTTTGKKLLGLGYNSSSKSAGAIRLNKGEYIEYPFFLPVDDSKTGYLTIACLPTHPALGENGKLRYAVSIDEEPTQEVNIKTYGRSEKWKQNVLSNQSRNTTTHKIGKTDKNRHVLKITALDDDIIVDQVFLDFIKDRKYYEIPQ